MKPKEPNYSALNAYSLRIQSHSGTMCLRMGSMIDLSYIDILQDFGNI